MAMSATIHLWISASNESTAKLSLGKKQGHLFAGSREPGAGSREPGLTLSPSYTRPLQNSKAATLGVKPTHLLCISVEEVGGSTTTTPPFHHHHSTFPPPPLHHYSTFLHHGYWIVISDTCPPPPELQSKRRLRNR